MSWRPTDGPDSAHWRPGGLDDLTVEALGKLSEARRHLYEGS